MPYDATNAPNDLLDNYEAGYTDGSDNIPQNWIGGCFKTCANYACDVSACMNAINADGTSMTAQQCLENNICQYNQDCKDCSSTIVDVSCGINSYLTNLAKKIMYTDPIFDSMDASGCPTAYGLHQCPVDKPYIHFQNPKIPAIYSHCTDNLARCSDEENEPKEKEHDEHGCADGTIWCEDWPGTSKCVSDASCNLYSKRDEHGCADGTIWCGQNYFPQCQDVSSLTDCLQCPTGEYWCDQPFEGALSNLGRCVKSQTECVGGTISTPERGASTSGSGSAGASGSSETNNKSCESYDRPIPVGMQCPTQLF
jgi:hypothetical protein